MAALKPGDEIEVTPDGIGKRGDATASHDGIRLRVRGGIPGEAARVRIRHVSRGGPVAEADFLESARSPHPLRTDVVCPIHDRCGGCGLQHVDAFSLKIEQARRLLPGAWGEPIASPRAYGYRAKAFLLSDGSRFGVRPPRGAELIDTGGCAVLRPEVEAALEVVRARLDPALVRAVMVRGNRAGEVCVTLVHRGPAPVVDPPADPPAGLPEGLREEMLADLPFDCLYLQRHDAPGNRICSDEREVQVKGDGPIRERYGPLSAAVPPTAFCQANPDVAEALYRAAADELVGESVAEFYCGAGVAGLLAAHRARLTGIDKSPRAVELARANAAANGLEADFAAVAAEDYPPADWESVLVNPPRGGCHPSVLERLRTARRVVYLSCNPVTLARDIERLGFFCRSLRAADMLPQTPHLELLAVLEP